MSVVHVSPFRCRIWNLHDRIDDYVDEKSCRDEIQSFGKSGQLMPVLGRPVTDDPDFDIEIVCGARRLFVARHLNLPLAVELRPMSDREAVIAMDIENRQRQSVSPYERGLSYTRWIRGRLFGSQEELAKTIGISPSQVSRLMKMAKLPSAIINAFGNPTELCEEWGLALMEAMEDPVRRDPTLRRARLISEKPRPRAEDVFNQLIMASPGGRYGRTRQRDQVYQDDLGRPLFRVREQRSTLMILLPIERLPHGGRSSLVDAIRTALCAEVESRREGGGARGASGRTPVLARGSIRVAPIPAAERFVQYGAQ